MRRLTILGAVLLSAALAACGGSSKTTAPYNGFVKPAGTVAVSFTVDDTANQLFAAGDLQWKGAMLYSSTTRIITPDATWSGPWATLYDDGPYTAATTQHEAANATASDHKWSVTVFVTPPATGSATYEYGLNDAHACTADPLVVGCNGWVWKGSNGSFVVAAGATADITASGITFPVFGTTDLRLTIDKNALSAGTWDSTKVSVKSSAWGWSELELKDDGTKGDAAAADGVYTFVLSQYAGAGKIFPHSGLTGSGDKPEFVFVFNGVEYKTGGNCLTGGVTAATKASGAGTFTGQTISVYSGAGGNGNTYITVP